MRTLNIGVFFVDEHKKWVLLETTSKLFTESQIVPMIGDRVSVLKNDWGYMGLVIETQFQSILTVENRVTPFNNYDFAIVCKYEKW